MKTILIVLLFLLSMDAGTIASAQPIIPRGKIPSDIPEDVRLQIDRLYSSSGLERADAAHRLGQMGEKATPAIPFLIGMLGDIASTVRLPSGSSEGSGWKKTSPGKEAGKALIKIGKSAVEQLIGVLKDKGSLVGQEAAEILKKITGHGFGPESSK